jgi:hypothetical protein
MHIIQGLIAEQRLLERLQDMVIKASIGLAGIKEDSVTIHDNGFKDISHHPLLYKDKDPFVNEHLRNNPFLFR